MPTIGSGLNAKRCSRPDLTLRTMAAVSSTCRCFRIACRVSRDPRVSCEIECGSPRASFATSASRVSSPSAKKTDASARRTAAVPLRFLRDIALDVLHLLRPAPFVTPESFQTQIRRQLVESRLDDAQQRAVLRLLQPELHQRLWIVG